MNLNNANDCYMEDCYNNRELKYFDKNPGTYEVHNLGEIVSLFNPTRGDDLQTESVVVQLSSQYTYEDQLN